MDTTRGILFLVVTLIIIVSIYYIVKMVKGRTPLSPSPSSSYQTGKISISDLKFERTLNPDKSNSKGDDVIVGYTIEYDNGINGEGPSPSPSGINYKELSENVTFTLEWTNNIGFTDSVTGFEIQHYVEGFSERTIYFYKNNDPKVNVNNFEENKVSIKGNGEYSVVGENRFKISVIMNDGEGTVLPLYDGTEQKHVSHGIKISKDELGATLSMTKPETVTYTPVTQSFSSTSVKIKKVKYSISNGSNSSLNFANGGSIYLIPAYSGVAGQHADTFFFKYELGENQYLLQNGEKGDWNKQTYREPNAKFNSSIHDNRMFVAFYDKNGDVTQLRAPVMGYGLGGEFLTSDDEKKVKLISMSENDTVNKDEFNNSYWTFTEVEGDPENCTGEWVLTEDGISPNRTGTKIETFNLISAAKNNGTCEASDKETRETLVPVKCIGKWDVTNDGTTDGSGTKIEKFTVTDVAINGGTCEDKGKTRETLVPITCIGEWGSVCKPDGGNCGWNGSQTYTVTREAINGGTPCKDEYGNILKTGSKKSCYLGQCGGF